MKRIILLLFFIYSATAKAQNSGVKEIVRRMFTANENLKSAKFTMYSEERLINGKFMITERFVKIKTKPKQIYFYSVKPNPGSEILWKSGWQDNKMLISPGSFPYVTFSLKTTSSIARKDSHHSIEDLGFEYVSEMVKSYSDIYGEKFYDNIKVIDTVQWDNRTCIRVNFDFKDYAEVNYTVKKNENVMDIARRYHLNDYSILIANPKIDDYDDVDEGQVIRIPNFYCRRIEFYVDRTTGLPLKQLIYDNKGLYELYEMKSFLLNPTFKPDEFTPDFEDYDF